jgi:subtilisin-like proprotein convertase family protein
MNLNITLINIQLLFRKAILMLTLICFFTGVLNAQTYSNGLLSTGATATGGTAAPAGFTWSELQGTNTGLGSGANIGAGLTLADNFVVPAGEAWSVSKVVFYAYSTAYTGATSPFNDSRVQIFNTNPSIGTPSPIFGDLTTNRFITSSTASIYRIGNAAPGTTRQVWKIEVALGTLANPLVINAGNYWIEWQHGTIAAGASNFSPAKTVVGSPTQAGNNSLQHTIAGNLWAPITDVSGPQDFPFEISYVQACSNVAATTPIVLASSLSSCAGTPVTLTANGNLNNSVSWKYYTGSCGGTLVGTGNSISVSPTVTTTYYVRGEGGCGTTPNGVCGQVTINVINCACVTPSAATICEGSTQSIKVNGAATIPAGPSTIASGPISVTIPDNTPAGITSSLNPTFPAGQITSMSVNFSMTHTWDSDISINLVSSNGTVLNLVNAVGGSGDNFTNTTISSTATVSLASGTPPFSAGPYLPSASPTAGPTGFPQTPGVTDFATFMAAAGSPKGEWKLALRDAAGGDIGILTNWSMTFNYNLLPTAVWTGATGTMFTNAATTIPYVTGSAENIIWVKPTTTSTYTATISAGPCAGANNVVVTVLPRPVVALTPLTSCSPATLTATGAINYSWTPAGGLNSTSGASVIASPTTTTIYSVTGLAANGCFSTPASATVNASPITAVVSILAGATFQINEGFTTVLPTGWARQNLSSPVGATTWQQGGTALTAFNGPATSYALANFQNTSPTSSGEISTWLFTPVINVKNGDQLTFYTRTATGAPFADRLEVRLSANGASVNAGTTNTSVGDFTNLMYTVNPNLVSGAGTGIGTSGYPDAWTKLTATVSGITGTVTGRIAFRYFVTDGGGGNNSNIIGLDQVEYFTPASINCANTVNNLQVNITGGISPYTLVYSDGTVNTTFNNYASGTNITVAPSVTTTYSVVSITGANGCTMPTSGISGTAVVTVTPVAAITTQPANKTVCVGGNTVFSVTPNTFTGTTFQWQLNTVPAPGAPSWVNITNGGVFSNATTGALNITGATANMLGNTFRVIVTGFCGGLVTSAPATLFVVTAVGGTAVLRDSTICANGSASFALVNTLTGGPGITHNFQVSTDGGTTFTRITNGGIYSGATTTTLTVTAVPNTTTSPIIYKFRDSINVATACGFAPFYSNVATLTVNPLPVVTISAAPIVNLFPGLTSTLTAASSATIYQWFKNGIAVPGATNKNYLVDINTLGTYSVRVTDANGCVNLASGSTPVSIKIGDSATVDRLFIYSSPNNGNFQVRYYTNVANDAALVPAVLNVYDEKGARVFTRTYAIGNGYQPMQVNLGTHSSGLYRVDLLDNKGRRIKTGTVTVF